MQLSLDSGQYYCLVSYFPDAHCAVTLLDRSCSRKSLFFECPPIYCMVSRCKYRWINPDIMIARLYILWNKATNKQAKELSLLGFLKNTLLFLVARLAQNVMQSSCLPLLPPSIPSRQPGHAACLGNASSQLESPLCGQLMSPNEAD